MKNILLPLIALFLFISCSDDSTGPSFNEKGHFSVKYNGNYWTPETSNRIFAPKISSHGLTIGKLIHHQNGTEFTMRIPLEEFDNVFCISTGASDKTIEKTISFRLDSVKDVGQFEVPTSVSVRNDSLGFDYSDLKTGMVEITDLHIDTTHIYNSDEEKWYVEMKKTSYVKGKFEFYFEDEEGKVLNVTEGKFFLENQSYYNY